MHVRLNYNFDETTLHGGRRDVLNVVSCITLKKKSPLVALPVGILEEKKPKSQAEIISKQLLNGSMDFSFVLKL